jgi:hypothetical protein
MNATRRMMLFLALALVASACNFSASTSSDPTPASDEDAAEAAEPEEEEETPAEAPETPEEADDAPTDQGEEENGDDSFSFADELDGETDSAPPYSSYTRISDDSGAIQVEVPAEWADVDGAPLVNEAGEQVGVDVRAAANLDSFQTTWNEPGMIFSASSLAAQSANEVSLLDDVQGDLSSQCTYEGRLPYEDAAYTGQYDLYTGCGGTSATYVVVGAVPDNRSFVMRVQIQANADRDFAALDHILDTFVVVGDV